MIKRITEKIAQLITEIGAISKAIADLNTLQNIMRNERYTILWLVQLEICELNIIRATYVAIIQKTPAYNEILRKLNTSSSRVYLTRIQVAEEAEGEKLAMDVEEACNRVQKVIRKMAEIRNQMNTSMFVADHSHSDVFISVRSKHTLSPQTRTITTEKNTIPTPNLNYSLPRKIYIRLFCVICAQKVRISPTPQIGDSKAQPSPESVQRAELRRFAVHAPGNYVGV